MHNSAVRASRSISLMGACVVAFTALSSTAFDPDKGGAPRLPSTTPITGKPSNIAFPEVTGMVPPAPIPSVAVSAPPAPAIPAADPTVAAQAAREMQVAQPQDFVAPAPLTGQPAEAPKAAELASAPTSPPTTAVEIKQATLPETSQQSASLAQPIEPEKLSIASKKILSVVPSKMDAPTAKPAKLKVARTTPEIQPLTKTSPKVESYDAVGLSIKVQRPGLDTNYELNRAYSALMGGDTASAIETYKNVLSTEPENEDALFGLASIYHRAGDLDKARPYYGQLLKINPNHREGLNNFMALISDEAPQEALAELERLEQRNPDFSPIPAQQALLLRKLGFGEQARDKMLRAIELAPENLTYRYNLAVMLDKEGDYTNAAALYRMLIDASLKGEKVPATAESLQKRLNFIASTQTASAATPGT